MTVSNHPEESVFSSREEADARIILHCLNIRTSLPDTNTIVVRSPDTDVLVLLARYCKEINLRILFDTGTGNKRHLLNVNDIVQNKCEDIYAVLPAIHCFTGYDTNSAFVRRRKIEPIKLIEKKKQFDETLNRLGQEQYCSEALFMTWKHTRVLLMVVQLTSM